MGLTYDEFEGKFKLQDSQILPGQLETLLSELWTPAHYTSFVVYKPLHDVSLMFNVACIVSGPNVDLGDRKLEDLSEEEGLSLFPYINYTWPVCVEQKSPRAWHNLFGIIPRPVIKEERLVRKHLISLDSTANRSASYGPDLLYFVLEQEGLATKVRVRADSQEDIEKLTPMIRGFNALLDHLNENPSTWKDRLHNPKKYGTE